MINPHPILVISSVIVDHVVLPDGAQRPAVLGGAATYSAIGACSWWPQVAIVGGVGRDFTELAGGRFERLGLRSEGLSIRGERTIRSRLAYSVDGTRTESPTFGSEHFAKMQATPEEVPDVLLPAAGTYFFRDTEPQFWRSVERRRTQFGTTLWEWHANGATPAVWPAVCSLLPMVDIFSLTLGEAKDLINEDEPQTIVNRLLLAGAGIIVLRMGADGALIADRRDRWRLRPPPSRVVDVTGAGNSFCGGFLAGWCKSQELECAARAAAAAAARTMEDYGPPDFIDHRSLEALAEATELMKVGVIA